MNAEEHYLEAERLLGLHRPAYEPAGRRVTRPSLGRRYMPPRPRCGHRAAERLTA